MKRNKKKRRMDPQADFGHAGADGIGLSGRAGGAGGAAQHPLAPRPIVERHG